MAHEFPSVGLANTLVLRHKLPALPEFKSLAHYFQKARKQNFYKKVQILNRG